MPFVFYSIPSSGVFIFPTTSRHLDRNLYQFAKKNYSAPKICSSTTKRQVPYCPIQRKSGDGTALLPTGNERFTDAHTDSL